MGDFDRILQLAREQIGTAETPAGSNNVSYNTDYYGGPVSGDSYPWCCAFIWWLFDRCGLSRLFCGGQKTAYCPFVESWARANGAWVTDGYRPGDLVLFDWNGDGITDHIGIVTAVSGNALTTIEGNASDAVREMTRSAVAVKGAYRPDYGGEDAQEPDAGGEDGVYTVKAGDTLWGIAERLLGRGELYFKIMQANGLTSDWIWPGQILKIPGSGTGRRSVTMEVLPETYQLLQIMAEGNHMTFGEVVDLLLEDAV